MMVLLVCLGSIAARGPLFANIDWRIVTVAVLTLVAVQLPVLVLLPAISWQLMVFDSATLALRASISLTGLKVSNRSTDRIYFKIPIDEKSDIVEVLRKTNIRTKRLFHGRCARIILTMRQAL